MTTSPLAISLFIFVLVLVDGCIANTFVPSDLRCQNKVGPVGVGKSPKFSWKFQSTTKTNEKNEARNKLQKAYQLVVEREKDQEVVWDTGRITSNNNYHIVYGGKDLEAHTKYQWRVKVWDEIGSVTEWTSLASFATSMLFGNWSAQWITTQTGSTASGNYLRKQFSTTPNKKIYQALVSVAGLGLYELYLNGAKVGDDEINNGFTNYNKTVLVSTYDVTSTIRDGTNYTFCMGAILGNGMYNVFSEAGRYTKFVGSYGPRKLFVQLDVEYTDGTITTIITDETWKATQGPIIFTSIYGGEDYNATMEETGWDQPNFNDNNWSPAQIIDGPSGTLTTFDISPVKVKEVLHTQNITKLTETSFIYDLGHNFAGWPHIVVKGAAGASVRLTPGEVLVNGNVYQRNSGSPAYFTYILQGKNKAEDWHPRFSYYGFRWVQVNLTGEVDIVSLEGHFIHADLDIVGTFVSSNQLLNQIHEIILTSYKSNLQSIFHDCPHREKLGWLEQAHLLAKSVSYNFDVSKLFAKSVNDMFDSQLDNGLIPDIAPEYTIFPGPYRDAPEWGSTYILIPYFLYTQYGDISTLSQHYASMMEYLGHLTANAVDNIISYGLGDWCDIVLFPTVNSSPNPKLTPVNFTSTSVYFEDILALNASAQALGLQKYVQQFSAMAESVKQSHNDAFFNNKTFSYSTNSQTANGMAIALGLSDPSNNPAIIDSIIKDVRNNSNHTTCGEIGHVYFLRALAQNGRSDIIYDIHTRTDIAGYGYMLTQGATALAETWSFDLGDSHNHAMFGHVEEWFYEYLGGIQFSLDKIEIKPTPLPELQFVNTTFKSIFGTIESSWKKDPETSLFHLNVVIPVNSRAMVTMPAEDGMVWESGVAVEEWHEKGMMVLIRKGDDACQVQIGSGEYFFTSKLSQ